MENTTFTYKTTLSKTNVKIDIMASRNRPTTKSGVFQLTTLFFSKFNFGTTTYIKFYTVFFSPTSSVSCVVILSEFDYCISS